MMGRVCVQATDPDAGSVAERGGIEPPGTPIVGSAPVVPKERGIRKPPPGRLLVNDMRVLPTSGRSSRCSEEPGLASQRRERYLR
jgi:hypothetical protein